jgi:hypothetical protein
MTTMTPWINMNCALKKLMEPQFNIYSNTATTQKIGSLSYCLLYSKLNILLQFLFLSKLILLPPSTKWYIADIWMSLFILLLSILLCTHVSWQLTYSLTKNTNSHHVLYSLIALNIFQLCDFLDFLVSPNVGLNANKIEF